MAQPTCFPQEVAQPRQGRPRAPASPWRAGAEDAAAASKALEARHYGPEIQGGLGTKIMGN